MKRTIGIRIFSLIALIVTLAYLGSIIFTLIKFPDTFSVNLAIYGVVYGFIILIATSGFYLLKNWARMTFILLLFLKLGENIFYIILNNFQTSAFVLEKLTNIVMISFIIFFLSKKSTKKQFISNLNSKQD